MLQFRDTKLLPKPGPFNLGRAGWIPNLVTVSWACLVLIFYDFPTELPVTVGNMSMFKADKHFFENFL